MTKAKYHQNDGYLSVHTALVLVLLLGIFLLLPCRAQTQTAQPLAPINMNDAKPESPVSSLRTISLPEAFNRATENNKQFIAAKYNLPISKSAIKIAGAIPNPQFTFLYGFGPAFKTIIAGNPQQFGWMETIQTAGKRTKKLNVARANYQLAELQLSSTEFSIHNRVRRAYAELAAAEAYADLIESERKIAQELAFTAEKRFQAGKVAKAEFLQAELGVVQFDTQRTQAQCRLEQATCALALLIGETPKRVEVIDVDDNGIFKLSASHTDLVPQPDHPLPPLAQLIELAYKQRADYKVNVQQAFADRRALSLARSQRIPNINVDCGYQFTTFTSFQPYNLFPGAVPNSPGCYLNISGELPIFYQYQGEARQAKATWLQDYDQTDQFAWQMSANIVTAYEEINVAKANIGKFQKDLIPAASEVSRLAFRRYQVGKGDLASAILAKQQYQQILSSYFDAVSDYQGAWADLEQAMGVQLKL